MSRKNIPLTRQRSSSTSELDDDNHDNGKTGQYDDYTLVEKVYPTLRDLQQTYTTRIKPDVSKFSINRRDVSNKLRSYFPVTVWLPQYTKDWIKKDVTAGLTVSILLVPQSMAYAQLAGLPEVYGLYASVIPIIIFSLMTTSTQVAIGPVAPTAIMIASGVAGITSAAAESAEYISVAMTMSFMAGILMILMGFMKFGSIVVLLSKPVMTGFIMAAAFIILVNQMKSLLKLPIGSYTYFYQTFYHVISNLDSTHGWTLLISIISIIILYLQRWFPNKIPRWFPIPLLLMFGMVLFSYLFDWENSLNIQIIGSNVPIGLATTTPDFSILPNTIAPAFIVGLVSYMGSIALSKQFETRVQQKTRESKIKYENYLASKGYTPQEIEKELKYMKTPRIATTATCDSDESSDNILHKNVDKLKNTKNNNNSNNNNNNNNCNTAETSTQTDLYDNGINKKKKNNKNNNNKNNNSSNNSDGGGSDDENGSVTNSMDNDSKELLKRKQDKKNKENKENESVNCGDSSDANDGNDEMKKKTNNNDKDKNDDSDGKENKENDNNDKNDNNDNNDENVEKPIKPVHLPVDANQEFIAYGAANLIGAFFGGQIVSGSFSRSALNFEIECYTPVSGFIQAFICFLCLMFLITLLSPLPKCVLAAVVAASIHGLIKDGFLKFYFLWQISRIELIEFLISVIAPLIVGLEIGLAIGVATSLIVGIFRHSRAKVVELGELVSASNNNEYVSMKHFPQALPIPGIRIIEMRAELSFTNSRRLVSKIRELVLNDTQFIIVSMAHTSTIDSSSLETIVQLFEDSKKSTICLTNCRSSVRQMLRRYASYNEKQHKKGNKKKSKNNKNTTKGGSGGGSSDGISSNDDVSNMNINSSADISVNIDSSVGSSPIVTNNNNKGNENEKPKAKENETLIQFAANNNNKSSAAANDSVSDIETIYNDKAVHLSKKTKANIYYGDSKIYLAKNVRTFLSTHDAVVYCKRLQHKKMIHNNNNSYHISNNNNDLPNNLKHRKQVKLVTNESKTDIMADAIDNIKITMNNDNENNENKKKKIDDDSDGNKLAASSSLEHLYGHDNDDKNDQNENDNNNNNNEKVDTKMEMNINSNDKKDE